MDLYRYVVSFTVPIMQAEQQYTQFSSLHLGLNKQLHPAVIYGLRSDVPVKL